MRLQLAQTLLVSALLSSTEAAPWTDTSVSSSAKYHNGQYEPDNSGQYQPGKTFKGSDGKYIPDDSGKYKPDNSGQYQPQQGGQDDSRFNRGGKNYNILKTTQYQGQTLDWISRDAQGPVAAAPPNPYSPQFGKRRASSFSSSFSSLWDAHTETGPDGSVPFLRDASNFGAKQKPLAKPESPKMVNGTLDYSGIHYHAGSSHAMDNHGTAGVFAVYDPYVQTKDDFSLLQINVGWNIHEHTIEAGIIHFESMIRGSPKGNADKQTAPIGAGAALFTYYTVNGYGPEGDNLGGWNTENAGWVQVDRDIYPGILFNKHSTRGGAQVECQISYYLYQGNWWLWVADRWIGYYPGSIFPKNAKGEGISVKADHAWYYGEVAQSESAAKTTTDMGSGEYANTGYGKAAYVRNIVMFDLNDQAVNFDAKNIVVAEPTMYSLETHWNSGKPDWNSYCFIGGPGGDGKTGPP